MSDRPLSFEGQEDQKEVQIYREKLRNILEESLLDANILRDTLLPESVSKGIYGKSSKTKTMFPSYYNSKDRNMVILGLSALLFWRRTQHLLSEEEKGEKEKE